MRPPQHPLWGERLLAARTAAGLTQSQLADALGVTQQRVSHWENGHGAPRDKYRPIMAGILGVTVYHLFPYEEPNGERAA
jgi:HTH-type transcriptional regulator, cell division transcriptional repressor